MTAFEQALQTGRTIVRRVWVNANTETQMSVQFAQLVNSPGASQQSKLIAMAQGYDNAGKTVVTAIFSFDKGVCEALGLVERDYFEDASAVYADDIFGEDPGGINIQVWENCTPRSWTDRNTGQTVVSNQDPKINPKTNEVLLVGDKPIYRHTKLIQGVPSPLYPTDIPAGFEDQVKVKDGNVFIQHTSVKGSTSMTSASQASLMAKAALATGGPKTKEDWE